MTEPRVVPHGGDGTDRPLAVLKSPPYGPTPTAGRSLPYRIDLLERHGLALRWVEHAPTGRAARLVARSEAVAVPFAQAWAGRRQRRDAVAVLAMFESEAHGVALARRVTRRRRPPLVVVACWLADLVVASPLRRQVYRRLYRSVDAVVVFSENQRRTLMALLDLPAERIIVVRFGVDLEELAALAVSEGGAVVAVGRDQGRDWATLAGAARGTGWSVELVTRARQVQGIDLPDEVHRRDQLDRAAYHRLLASATVVVVPTEVREYPTGQTVLLEAMALGKACVVTATAAMADYVIPGETALVVPPHDPSALRVAVDRLLGDPELRARLGTAARAAEQDHGGAARMWEEVARVVHDVADPDRPSELR